MFSGMPIIAYPNPILRQKSVPVAEFDGNLISLAAGMTRAMRTQQGIGLAANQVGVAKRVILIEINKDVVRQRVKRTGTDYGKLLGQTVPLTVLVNPEIVRVSAKQVKATEGCLSLHGIEVAVVRAESVKVKAQNLSGRAIKISAKGLYARVLQHEVDHINGVLIIDHGKPNPKH